MRGKLYRVNHAPVPGKVFVTRILTCELLAVAVLQGRSAGGGAVYRRRYIYPKISNRFIHVWDINMF